MALYTLKAARVNAGLTQAQIAEQLDVSPITIWKWETGKAEPKASKFMHLCKAYGVKAEDVFLPEA